MWTKMCRVTKMKCYKPAVALYGHCGLVCISRSIKQHFQNIFPTSHCCWQCSSVFWSCYM